jgi:hypothetical protein
MKPATKRSDVIERERRQRPANDGHPTIRVRIRAPATDDPEAETAVVEILLRMMREPPR